MVLSSTEAEYASALLARKHLVWMRMILDELGLAGPNPLYCYNQNIIKLI